MTEEKEGKSYDLEERLIDFHLLKMDRAQRYNPSTFDILRFCGSTVRFSPVPWFCGSLFNL